MTALRLLPQSAGFASNVSEAHVKAHKSMKGLKSQNLRDHMSEAELIFTALAELSTRQIVESMKATGMDENESAAIIGGGIARKARLELEGKTGRKVLSKENYLPPRQGKISGGGK
jgi:1,6-anhydro-N-acetylmuramate kinase